MKARKHAELIKAWADGAVIQQYKPHLDEWHDTSPYPVWDERVEYRIKPEPKPDIAMYYFFDGSSKLVGCNYYRANLRLVVDGKTGELKSAEVLK
jgi:hypothetical protein